ncbi:MAG: enoyl-CoA hydratase/isomerase family protein [Thermoplasmata archaeon]|nr:enoyl-CoA hydratase-related protein [Thermoplasmata archaeon]
MPTSETGPLVRYERRGRTLLLTLDHPPVNVLSRPVLEALSERLEQAENDPEVHAVVLASAAEKAFAAGADIREMATLDPADARVHGERGQGVTRHIERLPLPVIAAVHGVCLGGGCEVALACDLIVASEDAQFGQPEINLGVMPGWGGTQRLARRIGAGRARRWIYTGRSVSARDAESQGLVDRVVPRNELLTAAIALADEIGTKPPVAVAAAKYAIAHSVDPAIDDGLAYELDLWSRLFGTQGQKEGMAAFLAKRPTPSVGREAWDSQSAGFPWSDGRGEPLRRKRNKEPTTGPG